MITIESHIMENLDIAAFKKRVMAPNMTDDLALLSLHKARYESPDVRPELRHESRAWLEKGWPMLDIHLLRPVGGV